VRASHTALRSFSSGARAPAALSPSGAPKRDAAPGSRVHTVRVGRRTLIRVLRPALPRLPPDPAGALRDGDKRSGSLARNARPGALELKMSSPL